jgi:long-chain acyl-CoA synthetase
MIQSSSAASGSVEHFFAGLDTIPALLAKRAALTPDTPAHFTQDKSGAWRPTSWSDLAAVIARVAAGLADLGLRHGDRVAILAGTSQDWEICQIAALQLGATVIGIDPYYPAEQVNRIISELKPVALVAGNQSLLERVLPEVRAQLRLVLMIGDSAAGDGIVSLASLKNSSKPALASTSAAPIRGDDPAMIFFSSGTTGTPKPVVYTHAQVCLACRAILEAYEDIEEGCNLVCWMPLANPFQRIINFCGFVKGAVSYIVDDPRRVMECIPVANPHVFITVPTFCERLYAGISENVAKLPKPIGALIRGGIAANLRENSLKAAGAAVPLGTRLFAALARRTVLKRLRGVMGTNLKYIVSGSAPCSGWLLDAFAAIGIPIFEAYGQSENIVPIAANVRSASKPGTVGRPFKYNEVRLSGEGVIEVRSPGVFHADLAENQARTALTPDGYLSTGDLGEFLEGGYLKLTGRQADVFKTANGRWVSPGDIEAALRRVRYVEHAAVLVRDGATILAIVVISAPAYTRSGELDLADARVQQEIRGDLTRELAALAPAIWPRGVLLTTRMFSIEGGELTTNFKLRRAAIDKKYDSALAGLSREIHAARSQRTQSDEMRLRVL